jgi:hypothetical protein
MYEAIYPDGKKETLLDVPRYDFNWQTSYELDQPKVLPPGTRVHCVAHWDNSEDNLANPDPSQTVHWGDQTFEEMMLGFFDVAVPIDREKLLADGTVPKLQPDSNMEDRARELIANFDRDGDNLLQKEELPDRFQMAFGLLDGNKDEKIDVSEAANFIKLQGGRGRGRGGFGGGGRGRGERIRDGNRDAEKDAPKDAAAGN